MHWFSSSFTVHFSAPTPTIMVEAFFEGMDHLAVKSELLTIVNAETYIRDVDVSLEPMVNTLHGAKTLAII